MKNSRLLLLILPVLFSALCSAQKNNDTKIIIKTKKEKAVIPAKKENIPHFTQFGITSHNHNDFKNKYGVEVIYENCAITAFLSKQAQENNKAVASYLTQKYGETWKKDLGITPYGL